MNNKKVISNIKTPRDAKTYKDLHTRPITTADALSKRVPIRTVRNIPRGHFVQGVRDINRIGWKPWEQKVAEDLRHIENQRFAHANNFYSTLERIQVLLNQVNERNEELQATTEELQTANEEMETTNEELQTTTEELERANTELQRFAYVASHDLQEPLRMVQGYTQLLLRRYKGKVNGEIQELTNYIEDGVSRMQGLIDGLLAYSRVGAEGKSFELTDCNTVLEKAVENLQVAVEESKAQVTCDTMPTMLADSMQLLQLFQNLIGNAIKFHKKEEPPQVHISAEGKEREWVFSVQDNGIGIDPKYFDRLFVAFQRLHSRTEYPGSGIGLAICKKIVERHGGRTWVESEPGKGSTFFFTIPQSTEVSQHGNAYGR